MSSKKEEMARIVALVLVFIVVIFFWMSFHQNGLTLTLYARDYTAKQVGPFTNMFFTLPSLLAIVGSVAGLVLLVRRETRGKIQDNWRNTSLNCPDIFILPAERIRPGTICLGRWITPFSSQNSISPEVFQSFNPLFIVALTFPVMGAFAWLAKKGIEPSTPKKIGIGMIIAALGFIVVLISSIGLPSPSSLSGSPVNEACKGFTILADKQLSDSYSCRALPQPYGIIVCFESCPIKVSGTDAGRMAAGYSCRE